jgi:hypothetical protein
MSGNYVEACGNLHISCTYDIADWCLRDGSLQNRRIILAMRPFEADNVLTP